MVCVPVFIGHLLFALQKLCQLSCSHPTSCLCLGASGKEPELNLLSKLETSRREKEERLLIFSLPSATKEKGSCHTKERTLSLPK